MFFSPTVVHSLIFDLYLKKKKGSKFIGYEMVGAESARNTYGTSLVVARRFADATGPGLIRNKMQQFRAMVASQKLDIIDITETWIP